MKRRDRVLDQLSLNDYQSGVPAHALPYECIIQILALLQPPDISACAATCKLWAAVIRNHGGEDLWEIVHSRVFGGRKDQKTWKGSCIKLMKMIKQQRSKGLEQVLSIALKGDHIHLFRQTLLQLEQEGMDIDEPIRKEKRNRETCITSAVRQDSRQCAEYLMKRGADATAVVDGSSAVLLAITTPNSWAIPLLLFANAMEVSQLSHSQIHVLLLTAVAELDINDAQRVLMKFKESGVDPRHIGKKLLARAVSTGKEERIDFVLSLGLCASDIADGFLDGRGDPRMYVRKGFTPFARMADLMIEANDLNGLHHLIEHGSDIDERNLDVAIMSSAIECMEFLIDTLSNRGKMNLTKINEAVCYLVRLGSFNRWQEALQLLLKHGADLAECDRSDSILVELMQRSNTSTEEFQSMMLALIAAGADVNARTMTGLPVIVEAFNRCWWAVDILLDHGADIHASSATNVGVVHALVTGFPFNMMPSDVQQLERFHHYFDERGVDLERGITAANYPPICYARDIHNIRFLIERGASVNMYKDGRPVFFGYGAKELRLFADHIDFSLLSHNNECLIEYQYIHDIFYSCELELVEWLFEQGMRVVRSSYELERLNVPLEIMDLLLRKAKEK